jgi:trimeric autotransporter adhesin
MNKSYRVIWNDALNTWVASPEVAKSKSKSGNRSFVALGAAVASIGLTFDAHAYVIPNTGNATADGSAIAAGDGAWAGFSNENINPAPRQDGTGVAGATAASIAIGDGASAAARGSIAIGTNAFTQADPLSKWPNSMVALG